MAWKTHNQFFCKHVITHATSRTHLLEFSRCQIRIDINGCLSNFWDNNSNYATNGSTLEICVGKGATLFNIFIDQCLFTMRLGEVCELLINADGSRFEDLSTSNDNEVATHLDSSGPTDDKYFDSDDKLDWKESTDATNPKRARCGEDTVTKPQIIRVRLAFVNIIEQGRNIFDICTEDKLQIAQELKTKGADLFKVNIDYSFYVSSRAMKYVICIGDDDHIPQDLQEQVKLLKTQCYLNLSACQLQKGDHGSVIDNCTNALKLNPQNIKGLYRRALCYAKTEQYDKARLDLEKALQIEPNSKLFQNLLGDVQTKCKLQEQKLASAMSKMFK